MTIQELIAALHREAGGDNHFYDHEVVLWDPDGPIEWRKVDGVQLVNVDGEIKFEITKR